MMIQRKKGLKGFSLLELLLAIAIIGLIILMATRYFTTVKSGQQASSATQEIQGIRSAVSSQLATASGTLAQATLAQNVCNTLSTTGYCGTDNSFLFPWDTGKTTAGSGTLTYPSTTGGTFTITVVTPDLSTCQTVLSSVSKDLKNTTMPTCSASALSLDLSFSA
jgi:prepilin-type N-terminal cleavage/methylation domain-containing protein